MAHPIAEHLERALRATVEVARAFPADKLDFWPAANTMTVGEQIEHVALNLDYAIAPIATTLAIPDAVCPVDGPVAHLTVAVQRVNEILSQIVDDDWAREISLPDGFRMTVMQSALVMLEHDAHHRGQLIVDLRLLGINPPKRWDST